MPFELVIARATARRTVRSATIWGGTFGAYLAVSALGYASTYKTSAQRHALATGLGSNAGVDAIFGPTRNLDTVGGFTEWRGVGVLSLVAAVWGLLLGTRLLRGEEEAGRWELLVAGRTTRHRASAEGLVGLAAGFALLWAVPAVVSRLWGHRTGSGSMLVARFCS
jgi:ABC-2 type transport system permease protein